MVVGQTLRFSRGFSVLIQLFYTCSMVACFSKCVFFFFLSGFTDFFNQIRIKHIITILLLLLLLLFNR